MGTSFSVLEAVAWNMRQWEWDELHWKFEMGVERQRAEIRSSERFNSFDEILEYYRGIKWQLANIHRVEV